MTNKTFRKLFWSSVSVGLFLVAQPHAQAQNTVVVEVDVKAAQKIAQAIGPIPVKENEVEIKVAESEAERKEREKPKPVPTPPKLKPVNNHIRRDVKKVAKREVVARSTQGRVEGLQIIENDKRQCVIFVKEKYGVNPGSVGYARNWPINSKEPSVGAVIVTAESAAGHVGMVIGETSDTITIDEANYVRGKRSTRTISKNSGFIRGYYR